MLAFAMPAEVPDTLAAARDAYRRGDWADATALFLSADADIGLSPDDLEDLVWAAGISANDAQMLTALERLYAHHSAADDHAESARTAFWSGLRNMMIGEVGLGSGWLQRAAKHAEQTEETCVQRGYLLLPQVFMHRAKGAYEDAVAVADRALQFGETCGDPDLVALAGSLKGGLLFRLGRIDEGYLPIDETMLLANGGKLSPIVTGVVYCEIVASCCRVLEMVRAREWTAILNDWCRQNPQAKAFNGVCQMHRAEVLQLEGHWTEAYSEAERAGLGLIGTTERTARANAAYRRGEILRLRGRLSEAETEYRLAGEIGIDPQPGLALLKLAEGRAAEAASMIERALRTAGDMPRKAALLPAATDIRIAAGDLDAAGAACAEMEDIARHYGTEVLMRVADQGAGRLASARGDHVAGIEALTRARRYWSDFGAPYLEGCLRLDIARALIELGDTESARIELEAAEKTLADLGADPDLAGARAALSELTAPRGGGLTHREREVLRMMAEGGTNPQIAAELRLSPKTVNRHVENIFGKLGVGSRAAAVAVALKSGDI
ncbi:helix-turn-helix transcriptional regulator [Rhodobacterales bacterium HKCCE3408]|nr:helix-turn-helix transcriptional regulator [Rhodobacterales bacterium HKCCE3408]